MFYPFAKFLFSALNSRLFSYLFCSMCDFDYRIKIQAIRKTFTLYRKKRKKKMKNQCKTTFCSQVEEKHLLFTSLRAVKDMEEQTPEVNMLSLEIMNKGLCFCLRGRIGWAGLFFTDNIKCEECCLQYAQEFSVREKKKKSIVSLWRR